MRSLTVTTVLVVLGLFVLMNGCSNYNNFVTLDEDVNEAWGNVQNAYQRRSDLIPNLVETVKGEADFEQETLTGVIEARSNATKVNIDASNLTPEALQNFQKTQSQVSSALSRLLVTVERYPNLQANQAFRELQTQLEGTENRIKVARDRFNAAVTDYNKTIRRFPQSFYAGLFGFPRKSQFQADPGSENAPTVNFD